MSEESHYSLENLKVYLLEECGSNDFKEFEFLGSPYICSSTQKRHIKQWKSCCIKEPSLKFNCPAQISICPCGQDIQENCLIRHKPTQRLFLVGNICVKRFQVSQSTTCQQCGQPHRNRVVDLCNNCRPYCDCCRRPENPGHYCYFP